MAIVAEANAIAEGAQGSFGAIRLIQIRERNKMSAIGWPGVAKIK